MSTALLLEITFLIGIIAEAITAALSAGRLRFDIFGVMALAALTALGGGTVRDVILDAYPLTWVEQPAYLIVVLAAALITVSLSFLMHYFRNLFLVMDAVGLATFSLIGAEVAHDLGHGFVIICVSAVANGISGGVLRDVLSGRTPLVFSSDFYAVISVLVAISYTGLLELGVRPNIVIVGTLIGAFALRVLAIYRGWSLPIFDYRDEQQPVHPQLQRSYDHMRRGLGSARRRTEVRLESARYALLDRKNLSRQGRAGQSKEQSWPAPGTGAAAGTAFGTGTPPESAMPPESGQDHPNET